MRCKCMTLKGKRCEREAMPKKNFCAWHLKCKLNNRFSPKRSLKRKSHSRRRSQNRSPRQKININQIDKQIFNNALQNPNTVFVPNKLVVINTTSTSSPKNNLNLNKSNAFYNRNLNFPKVKIIGVGGYGCVTLPAFPCNGKNPEDYNGLVSKVLDEDSSLKEFEEGKKFSSIDVLVSGKKDTLSARYKYGLYALDRCPFPVNDPFYNEAFKNATGKTCDIETRMGKKWIIHMEKADGDFSTFEGKTLTYSQIKMLMTQIKNILLGLINMHNHEMYHLDLKPENMLYLLSNIFDNIDIKIADFGTSCSLNDNDFKSSFPFQIVWYNFPPASHIIGYQLENEKSALDVKYKKAETEYKKVFKSIDERYTANQMKEDVTQFFKENKGWHDLGCAVDIFGFAIAIKYFEKMMTNQNTKVLIREFCKNAAAMSMTDSQALLRFNEILYSL